VAFCCFLITLSWRLLSHHFISYWDFSLGEKERKAQGLAFGFNLLYGYLSQQQHFIANPPLPALFKKELARFHVSHQCLNVCIYSKTERHL
jgi:hypothetical protein